MSLKKHLKTYFSFSSSERKSLIILLTILLGVFAYPLFIPGDKVPVWEKSVEKQGRLDSLLVALTSKSIDEEEDVKCQKLFSFDPNQIDSSGMLLLGFSNYIAGNLMAYRKSGGNIADKADLRKIYGMTGDLYNKLEPYIQITPKKTSEIDSLNHRQVRLSQAAVKKPYRLFSFNPNTIGLAEWESLGVDMRISKRILNYLSKGGSVKKAEDLKKIYGFDSLKFIELEPYINIPKDPIVEKIQIDLNNADSTQLISLPGIGPYFTNRILDYREKLGGFYSLYQVSDIKGIRKTRLDSLKSYLLVDVNSLRFININKLNVDELSKHPYISYKEASDIVRLRKRKGSIVDLEILYKKKIFSESTFRRVKPYLVLE